MANGILTCVGFLLLLQLAHAQLDNCLPATCHIPDDSFMKSTYGSTETCFCDRQCYIHGDCCEDAEYSKSKVALDSAVKDLFENHLECSSRKSNQVPTNTWFVKTCPRNNVDYFLTSLCESEEYDSSDEYVRWPVSGNSTGLAYRNMYCAMCWRERVIKYWKKEVKCSLQNRQQWNEINLNNSINAITDKMNCEQGSFTNPIDSNHKRLCFFKKIVKTCTQFDNETNVEMCRESPTNIVSQRGTNTSYRNKYCALCNGVNETKLSCPFHNSGFRRVFMAKRYPLTLLFDLNIGKASVETSSNRKDSELSCSNTELHDKLTDTCRQVRCGIGYKFQDGRCKFDNMAPMQFPAMSGGATAPMEDRCAILTYQKGEYILRSDGVVIIKSLESNYTDDKYRFTTNGSIDVCVNDTTALNKTLDEQIFSSIDGVAGIITTIGQSISIICLILLLIVYTVLPKLRNVPGKSVMCLSVALMVGQLFFLIGPSASENVHACMALAIVIHFTFLCVFTWMNVLALDLASAFWWTKLVSRHDPASQRRRYLKFAAYAFSLPLGVVMIGGILDVYATSTAPYNPGYGTKLCWMNNGAAVGILFILPVSALLLLNCCLYALTIRGIYASTKEAKLVRKSDKTNLFLYIKLSLVLGGTWIFAFIWMLHQNIVIQYMYIILNSLQGLAVFVAFVCRAKVLRMLRLRYEAHSTPKREKDANATTRMTLLNASSSVSHDVTIRKN